MFLWNWKFPFCFVFFSSFRIFSFFVRVHRCSAMGNRTARLRAASCRCRGTLWAWFSRISDDTSASCRWVARCRCCTARSSFCWRRFLRKKLLSEFLSTLTHTRRSQSTAQTSPCSQRASARCKCCSTVAAEWFSCWTRNQYRPTRTRPRRSAYRIPWASL